jgi:hypothetical protein
LLRTNPRAPSFSLCCPPTVPVALRWGFRAYEAPYGE